MYAVIDLETTGLRSAWHDRVVEIAVVHVDATGRIEREWSTLVNPNRDLGPQRVHGISAAEARRAPAFDRLAGDVAALLRGRVVVAHNLAFDGPFLADEYRRLGVEVPLGADRGLCTMTLAAAFLPVAGRSLRACCDAAGVDLERAHEAADDARAAARLLGYYVARAGDPSPWAGGAAAAAGLPWPDLPANAVPPVSRRGPDEPVEHFLARLVDRLPRLYRPDADAYLDVLDRALVGRHISATDADALVAVADDLGLDRAEVADLHRRYLTELAAAAGQVTGDERHDLVAVADLLALTPSDVDSALAAAGGSPHPGRGRFRLERGDVVVFTGETTVAREVWEERARAAGLVVGPRVTKATRLVVAADPDTMSGKADLARRYGVPVVHPAGFEALLAALGPAGGSGPGRPPA